MILHLLLFLTSFLKQSRSLLLPLKNQLQKAKDKSKEGKITSVSPNHTSWVAQPLLGRFSTTVDKQKSMPALTLLPAWTDWLSHKHGRASCLTLFLAHQKPLCGQSRWEHQTLLPDTSDERVSVLSEHPEPLGWPLPPRAHNLDWLHPWWHRVSWHCEHQLTRTKEAVNVLFHVVYN